MDSTATLTMIDGVKVIVPDSLDLITPYVLREQQDWFEDEIKLLRRLLQPGQKVVDIGANYGLYSLSIAKTVGSSGHVWSFEPASITAGLLAESIAVNKFNHVTLEQCALSDTGGTAQLSMHSQAELNALVRDDEATQSTETVQVVTLDDYAAMHGWQDIDFVKIDAEGEEANILKGGTEFFSRHSPLVQYEVKAGHDIHLELAHAFADLGYESFRLVPGLDLLVPFRTDMPADDFLLNLFACKPDRAVQLESDGWLINQLPDPDSSRDLVRDEEALDWRVALATLPYGKKLAARWEMSVTGDDTAGIEEALALYALSRDASRPATERYFALDASLRRLKDLVGVSPTHPRLASLARVAQDFGARTVAIDSLRQLCTSIVQDKRVDLGEPFLAPEQRFDSLDPGEAFGDWMLVAAAETLQSMQAFSSFYSGISAQNNLEMICNSDFSGPESHRRLNLLQQRFNLPGSAPSS